METRPAPSATPPSCRWAVGLVGADRDLVEIAPHFTGSVRIELRDDGWELTSGQFTEAEGASTIWTLAAEILTLVNGIARLRLDRPAPISLGNVRRYREDGSKDAFMFPEPIRGSGRVMIASVSVNGVPVSPPTWEPDIELAARDLRVGAVLAFLATGPTWHSLFAAFDTVAEDERTQRLDGMKRWAGVSHRRIRTFTNTANCFSAVGALARHGPRSEAPPRPMALKDGEELVKRIVERWLDELKRVGA